MEFVLVTGVIAVVTALALVLLAPRYLASSADHDLAGPQKLHTRPVPRIGGVAVAAGLLIGAVWAQWEHPAQAHQVWLVLACAVPTLAAGLWEDFTKSVSPARRLAASVVSALMAIFLLGAVITRTGLPGFDHALAWFPVAVAFTVIAIAGTSNAINIIDGLNGLASMCVVIMLAGLAFVAWQVGDRFVFAMSLMVIGAALGFFVLNFPAGLIFLGDGGAYLLGFLLATLGILFIARHPDEVSPLFPLVLFAYPVFETVFSMYRRKVVRGRSASAPDGVHLHTLIYRRVIRSVLSDHHPPARRKTARNAMASPYLWLVSLVSVLPAVLFWHSTPALAASFFAFMAFYVGAYIRVVRFRVPRFLVLRRALKALRPHPLRGTGRSTALMDPARPIKVTVITVCHDDAGRIAQTLASVAAQSHPFIEHIVVDRGSTDGTLALLQPRGVEAPFRLVRCRSTRLEAMNRGLAAATGDLVGFLAAGDVFADAQAVAQLAAAAHASRSDVVYADLGYLRRGAVARLMQPWRPGEFSRAALRLGWMPPHATFYVKRNLLDLVGHFDARLRMAAEYDFILRCFAIEARKPAYVPQVLVKTLAAGQPLWPVGPLVRKGYEDFLALRRTRLGGHLTVALKVARRGLRFGQRVVRFATGRDSPAVPDPVQRAK